ncbi:MAG: hypothetical protein H6737_22690 [Alphaproteobacteria bacterium]|nr:hypothetical protein [Alphaproteobacteria bacterium]
MRVAPLLSLALLACDDAPFGACPPLFTGPPDACAFDEGLVPELVRGFDDGRLVRVNAEPFEQITENTQRNVWISRLPVTADLDTVDLYTALDPFEPRALDAPFPVGTVLLHERIDLAEGHTLQVRMPDDYVNAGGGPWWFGKHFADGTPDEVPCSPCEMCHSADQRPGTEGLWGVPPDAVAPGL